MHRNLLRNKILNNKHIHQLSPHCYIVFLLHDLFGLAIKGSLIFVSEFPIVPCRDMCTIYSPDWPVGTKSVPNCLPFPPLQILDHTIECVVPPATEEWDRQAGRQLGREAFEVKREMRLKSRKCQRSVATKLKSNRQAAKCRQWPNEGLQRIVSGGKSCYDT